MSSSADAGPFDCATCAACCREAYHCVEVHPRDRFARVYPDRLVRDGKRLVLPRPYGDCVCLGRDYTCDAYAVRPRTCRDFEVGGEHCIEARRRVGVQPSPDQRTRSQPRTAV